VSVGFPQRGGSGREVDEGPQRRGGVIDADVQVRGL
jgi:hypothetical protein